MRPLIGGSVKKIDRRREVKNERQEKARQERWIIEKEKHGFFFIRMLRKDGMKYLIFDIDDTLIPSTKFYAEAMQEIGVDPEDKAYLDGRLETKKDLPEGYPSSRNRVIYFKKMLELKGEYTPQRHYQLVSGYEKALSYRVKHFWESNRRSEIIMELKKQFKRVILLSNETTRMQLLKWQAMDPEGELFDGLITSEEVGIEKPHFKMFQKALQYLGNVPAEESVMVGDSFEHDIVPALDLGFSVIHTKEFKPTALRSESQRYQQIFHLEDLKKIIR
ncbi:MAG: HAD family hydrolase [Bdellovibrio sp.]|nr:MAG: HAD family hydrolase [Bdellovibrio sp.]